MIIACKYAKSKIRLKQYFQNYEYLISRTDPTTLFMEGSNTVFGQRVFS